MVASRNGKIQSHALVVGGTRGAGRIAVQRLVADGYRVSVLSRNPPQGPKSTIRRVKYWQTDICDPISLRKSLAKIHHACGAINCVTFFQRFRGASDAWQGELDTSLTGTRSVIEMLVEEFGLRRAAIVIVSSINASLISKHLPLGYHVAKAGLNQIVRYYAVSLGGRGIRINSVSPGTFLKEESRHVLLADENRVRLYQRIIPLGRLGTADEVVDAVAFLASPRSSFVTGQDLVVDGGLSLVFQESLAGELNKVSEASVSGSK